MCAMSMTAEAARRALEAAKGDDDFVRRYLDGDRQAFQHMQGLLQAAYPDEGPGDAADESPGPALAAPAGDGGGAAMPQWLLEAGDAGFAPPKSSAHYQFDYAPNAEIDPEFDRLARDWMYKAELPGAWSAEIARDYQRRAAKPPSADEIAQEREAVMGRLRRDWGDATDQKLAQVRALVRGIGDDRVAETLDRSGLGNNEWLIRQLAIHADRRAAKAQERGETDKGGEGDASAGTGAPYRDIAFRPGEDASDTGMGGLSAKPGLFVQLADKPSNGTQIAEATTGEREGAVGDGGRGNAPKLPYSDIPIGGGTGTSGAREATNGSKPPVVNLGKDRQTSIINGMPAVFKIDDNPAAKGDKPFFSRRDGKISVENHDAHKVDLYESIIEEEAKRQGVDPRLVKAIMYMETSHGRYGYRAEDLDRTMEEYPVLGQIPGVGQLLNSLRADSILPMNIRASIWSALGFSKEQLKDPRLNIRAGVMLLKRIIERIDNPTVAKVATLYNNLSRESVTDYGARVAEIYRQELWRLPKQGVWQNTIPGVNLPEGTP